MSNRRPGALLRPKLGLHKDLPLDEGYWKGMVVVVTSFGPVWMWTCEHLCVHVHRHLHMSRY